VREVVRQMEEYLDVVLEKASNQSKNNADDAPRQLHSHDIRASNALDTLTITLLSLFQKTWSNPTINLLTLITPGNDINMSDSFFERFVGLLGRLIGDKEGKHVHRAVRSRALILLLTILATPNVNLNQNALIDYFNIFGVLYESLMKGVILAPQVQVSTATNGTCAEGTPMSQPRNSSASSSPSHTPPNACSLKMKKHALRILLLLANYRKYESENVYLNHVRTENNAKVLFYLGDTVTKCLKEWVDEFTTNNEKTLIQSTFEYNQNAEISQHGSLGHFSWLPTGRTNLSSWLTNSVHSLVSQALVPPTSIMGGVIGATTGVVTSTGGRKRASSISAPSSEQDSLTSDQRMLRDIIPALLMLYEMIHSNSHFVKILTGSLSKIARKEEIAAGNDKSSTHPKSVDGGDIEKAIPHVLQEFISFCSIIFYHHAEDYDKALPHHAHLAIIIWICLLEHVTFQDYIFDLDISLRVNLFHKEKGKIYLHQYNGVGCVARVLFELLLQYTFHQARRDSFPVRQMRKAFAILHFVIGSAIARDIRLDLDYIALVNVCMRTLQICVEAKNFHLILQLLRLINMLVLCGDQYASTPQIYHSVLYELWRNRKPLDDLTAYIGSPELQTDIKGHSKLSVRAFQQLITNPMQVVQFFSDSLERTYGGKSFPTHRQASDLIQQHVDDLPLISIVKIEQIQLSYLENPNNVPFFTQYMRLFTKSVRKCVYQSLTEQDEDQRVV